MEEAKIAHLKYFMYILSYGNPIQYIDTDIRKIIWDYALEPHYITLKIANTRIKLCVYL